MNRLSEEMKLIPRAAWGVAVAICVVLPLAGCAVWLLLRPGPLRILGVAPPEVLIFVPIAVLLFLYILLVGYIAADSRRRGMRPVLWILLAIFIPNAIGIVLYFILRSPLLRSCSQCGATSNSTFAFCPACGAALSNACPSCRSAVEPGWVHCPKCGSSLRAA